MNKIKVYVNKDMDGYTFSILPHYREMINSIFPNAYPANLIYVNYNINADIKEYIYKLENYICPALFGLDSEKDIEQFEEIVFVDTSTQKIIYKIVPCVEKV